MVNTRKRILTEKIEARVRPNLKRELAKIAKKKNVKETELVRYILTKYVEDYKNGSIE